MEQWRVVIVLWGIVVEQGSLWQNREQLDGTVTCVVGQWSTVVEHSDETEDHSDGKVKH